MICNLGDPTSLRHPVEGRVFTNSQISFAKKDYQNRSLLKKRPSIFFFSFEKETQANCCLPTPRICKNSRSIFGCSATRRFWGTQLHVLGLGWVCGGRIWVYVGRIWASRTYLSVVKAYFSGCKAHLSVFRVCFSVCRAYLSVFRAYLSVCRASMSVGRALSLCRGAARIWVYVGLIWVCRELLCIFCFCMR